MLGLGDMPDPNALKHVALMDAGVRTPADSGASLSSPILDVSTGCGALQSGWFSLGEAFPTMPEFCPAHPVAALRRPGGAVA